MGFVNKKQSNGIRMKEPKENSIGWRIRTVRKERGLTQQQLAELIGTSQPVLQRYESNERAGNRLIRENYINLAEHLDVSLQWLLTGAPDGDEAPHQSIPVVKWSNLENWLKTRDKKLVREWLPLAKSHFNKCCIGVVVERDTLEFKTSDIMIVNTAIEARTGDCVIVNFSQETASTLTFMLYAKSFTAIPSLQVVGVHVGLYRHIK